MEKNYCLLGYLKPEELQYTICESEAEESEKQISEGLKVFIAYIQSK